MLNLFWLGLAAAADEPSAAGWQDHVQLEGYVDTYFALDSAAPADHRRPAFLYNYARTDGVTVNLAMLGVQVEHPDVRAAASMMAGTFAQDNQGGEEPGIRNILEARAGLRLAGRTWIDAGIFPSHIGAESAIGFDNPTLTRSLTAENSPYYLAGVKLSSAVGERIELGVVGANGWQSVQQTMPASGALGTWIDWQPTPPLTLHWGTLVGLEQPGGEIRVFNDLTATASLERVDLIAWVDVGVQAGDVWAGGNVQVRGWLTEAVGVSARAENFTDPTGKVARAEGVRLSGASVGLDVKREPLVAERFGKAMWRVEVRGLRADRRVFVGSHWDVLFTTSLAVGF